MTTVKQVQRTSRKARRNGLYLIRDNETLIGSIEKPFYNDDYRAQIASKVIGVFSTKLLAYNAVLQVVIGAH